MGAEPKVNGRLSYRLGNLFFRYRSFTPAPLGLLLIWQARVTWPEALWGLLIMATGENIRLTALRASGKATRTRQVGARRLVTWGLYGHTRNPLYIGNFLLWLGVVVFAGGDWQYWIMALVGAWFLLQYTLIISLEEATLLDLFGGEYEEYRHAVPRILPRLRQSVRQCELATPPPEGLHSWWYAFESERSTLGIVTLVLLAAWLSPYIIP